MIITIDGPTASGKSSVARALADRLGMYHLNSGLLFRAYAYLMSMYKKEQPDASFEDALAYVTRYIASGRLEYRYDAVNGAQLLCDGYDSTPYLKSPQIDQETSAMSMRPDIRSTVQKMQHMIAQTHDVVVDGRDAGSVVFPHADYKFFLTADVAVRAVRWQKDQERRGFCMTQQEAVAAISERDRRDQERTVAPLKIAHDAQLIDNSHLTFEETVQEFLKYVVKK